MSREFSEKWGTDVKTAVGLALDDLKLTIDEVEVTVLEEPSRGFFGIGSKLALVRVEKKKVKPEKPPEKADAAPKEPLRRTEPKKTELKKAELRKKETKKETKKESRKPGIKDEANKAPKGGVPSEGQSKASPGDIEKTAGSAALSFLREIANQMGLDIEVSVKAGDACLYVDICGKDSGTIIGKRGQTLDAVQYLTGLVVNRGRSDYIKVVVDAENYRAKREATLISLANRLAGKVAKTKKSIKLEPMNPYERKVIHAALQNNPHVKTRSEGQEPYRRVIIELK